MFITVILCYISVTIFVQICDLATKISVPLSRKDYGESICDAKVSTSLKLTVL